MGRQDKESKLAEAEANVLQLRDALESLQKSVAHRSERRALEEDLEIAEMYVRFLQESLVFNGYEPVEEETISTHWVEDWD